MGKKMSDANIDALFERMSKGTADKMTGTHPPKTKSKTTAKKKSKVSKKK